MQSEFKKKTMTYGVPAVLLAVLLTAMCYNFGVQPATRPFFPGLRTFSSYEELKNFLKTNMEKAEKVKLTFFRDALGEAVVPVLKATIAHSTTNIQVEGVDEADIAKTDGDHLYVVSGNAIWILQAYPPEQARVLSKIVLNETCRAEIYVHGDKLVLLGEGYQVFAEQERAPSTYTGNLFINVYDVSNRSNPIRTRTVILNGTLLGSRGIGSYVYAVVAQPAMRLSEKNETDFEVDLPKMVINNSLKEVKPNEIRYVDVPDVSYAFTTIIAVNIINDAQEPTYESILTSATSCMYVSTNNMYLTVPNTNFWILTTEAGETKYETLIYRISLDNEKIVWEAEGAVPGYVLNQFSMDEYNGFFRIATTNVFGDKFVNNLFVLNMSLSIVGNLINIDPGKQIYAARFMGDRCYLVTFYQKDPFIAIDVSNPFEPKILGALEIEGFSGYLRPYDENHVIGVGMEGINVKLSLYNVTDVTNPREIDKFLVSVGNWSSTPILWDQKAFLFNKERHLLALPISIWTYRIYDYGRKVFWQGAYIFKVSLKGFTLKGNITHQDDATWLEVKRILYIDSMLYTVSDGKVKINRLEDLAYIKEIKLS